MNILKSKRSAWCVLLISMASLILAGCSGATDHDRPTAEAPNDYLVDDVQYYADGEKASRASRLISTSATSIRCDTTTVLMNSSFRWSWGLATTRLPRPMVSALWLAVPTESVVSQPKCRILRRMNAVAMMCRSV